MLIEELRKHVFVQLFGQIPSDKCDLSNVFRKHNRNLGTTGDLSFSLNEIWMNKLLQNELNIDKEKVVKNGLDLKEKSKEWAIPIDKICINNERHTLHLNRAMAMKFVFNEILENSYSKINLKHNFRVIFPDRNSTDITNSRTNIIAMVLNNVIKFCNVGEFNSNSNYVDLHFSINGYKMEKNNENILIHCGIVVERPTKKKSKITFEEYLCSRRKDMQLIAMHKYGIRTKDSDYFTQLLDTLGRAAVIIDLVEVKHTSPVQIVEDNNGCSKGAAFILYNCARIEIILETFNKRVREGFYSELPSLVDVDLSNLTEKEEWELVYNYLGTFPDLIVNVLHDLEYGKCAPFLIPKFLNGLAALFSIYYRRVKILLDNRNHLMSAIFARIYLLKCIHTIFKLSLEFLDITPVKKM